MARFSRNGTSARSNSSQSEPRPTEELSKRGQRTRSRLLAAAREIFERDGFIDAKITDIPKAAGFSTGSFYTYFTDKEAVFTAVLHEAEDEMLHPGVHNAVGEDDNPRRLIELSNRAYLESYRRNAKLMALLEQVATIDEDFRVLQRQRSRAFVTRNARSFKRLQEAGLVDESLDVEQVSLALAAMVSRLAYLMFFLQIENVDFEGLIDTVNHIWMRALGIESAPTS